MPYKIGETTDKSEMTRQQPAGAGYSAEAAAKAAKMEIWGSSFNDPGDDWCEFRLFDAAGNLFANTRTPGY